MTDNERIRKKIEESGYKYNFVADSLEITRQTLSNKLNGSSEWTIREAWRIAELLRFSVEDFYQIFFAQEVKI